ncbi:MAG TPA: PilZ domain-containing protein [Phycisphaerae bacterium]|nr:PilZ domain-containing protein [Phycisphaerae bacterium]
MNSDILERRRDPRTQTFIPITLRRADRDETMPAHLLDLSYGGAGMLTTAYNAPALGEYIDLEFETPNTDGGTESITRRETGIVVNSARHEREIRRVGVRFVQHPDLGCGLFDPKDLLSNHRKMVGPRVKVSRWETARNFDRIAPAAFATAW